MKKNTVHRAKARMKRRFVVGIEFSVLVALILAAIVFLMNITARTASADDHEQKFKYYTSITVEKGDSLWSIAEQYAGDEYTDLRTYIDEVLELNGLKNVDIRAGAHLCVPYYSTEYK